MADPQTTPEEIGPYDEWIYQKLGDRQPSNAYAHGCTCYNCGCQVFVYIKKGTPVRSSGFTCQNCGVSQT